MWRERVFDLLLREEKIDGEVVRSMRGWPHAGFSIDNSVQIAAEDTDGMQRLVSYISRCPFSLARMIKVTGEGQVIYLAAQAIGNRDKTGDRDNNEAGVFLKKRRMRWAAPIRKV